MIRIATHPTPAPAWHAGFLALLPAIVRQAAGAFRHLKPEACEDAIFEVVANALVAYARLYKLGKADVAYPTPLARYGIAQYHDGRRVGNRHSVRDLLSQYAQRQKGFRIDRLDRYDAAAGAWREVLVEDRRAGPADIAAARIDFQRWFQGLTDRDQQIAAALAVGNSGSDVAAAFRISMVRVSQKRREYRKSWQEYQGEEEVAGV